MYKNLQCTLPFSSLTLNPSLPGHGPKKGPRVSRTPKSAAGDQEGKKRKVKKVADIVADLNNSQNKEPPKSLTQKPSFDIKSEKPLSDLPDNFNFVQVPPHFNPLESMPPLSTHHQIVHPVPQLTTANHPVPPEQAQNLVPQEQQPTHQDPALPREDRPEPRQYLPPETAENVNSTPAPSLEESVVNGEVDSIRSEQSTEPTDIKTEEKHIITVLPTRYRSYTTYDFYTGSSRLSPKLAELFEDLIGLIISLIIS
eukprot:sb/3468594/